MDAPPQPLASNDVSEITNSLQAMTNQEARGEHSPEPLTPTSIVNLLEDEDGPHTLEGAVTPETTEKKESQRMRKDNTNGGHP